MSDYFSNSNQSQILEQLADQDNISLLRNTEYAAGAPEETQETPSFCELVSQKKVRPIHLHTPK
jgi:hypothetical protein